MDKNKITKENVIKLGLKPRKTVYLFYLKILFKYFFSSQTVDQAIKDIIEKDGIKRYYKIVRKN